MKVNSFISEHYALYKLELFEESVLSIPWNTPAKSKKLSARKLGHLKKLKTLETLIDQGLEIANQFGTSKENQELAFNYAALEFANVYAFKNHETETLLDKLMFTLENQKGIYYQRQLGITKNVDTMFKDLSIPDHLIVVGISIDIDRDIMYLTRMKHNNNFVVFKLPLTRQSTREGGVNGTGLDYRTAMEDYKGLMQRNKETTANAKDCIHPNDRRKWFQLRKKLDQDIEKFLDKLEFLWLGGFKGLLSGYEYEDEEFVIVFKQKLEKLVFKSIKRIGKQSMLEFDLELCKTLLAIGLVTYEEAEDILYYLLDAYQSQGVKIEYDEIDMEEVFFY
jgi:hypothetical protein